MGFVSILGSMLRGGLIRTAAAALSISLSLSESAGAAGPPGPAVVWRSVTASPRPAPPPASMSASGARDAKLQAICGSGDIALAEVAAREVKSFEEAGSALAADDLTFSLRAAGDPHVWPRAWSLRGQDLDEEDIARRMMVWSAGWRALGERRCAVSRGTLSDGASVVTAVAIDALADMEPVPTTARVGQWISLRGSMLIPASAVRVVLLGPRGAPKTVLASLSGKEIRASFSVDEPGAWLVQVLATVSVGPRPVLEAMVFAGTTPPDRYVALPAPGEEAAGGAKDEAEGLYRMVNAARASEGISQLARDAALDKLAAAQVEAMVKAGMVAHDVGGGDLRERIDAAGLTSKIAGENLASAKSLENAHRALWVSPSHRGNLLLDQFKRVGVATARSKDGAVWVAEIFAG